MTQIKIAMLTAGGLAPCLSSAVGGLIERYSELQPDAPDDRLSERLQGTAAGQIHHRDA
jgi:pyrophosphate--fructose-6-phosphate 1-phosphotransferase